MEKKYIDLVVLEYRFKDICYLPSILWRIVYIYFSRDSGTYHAADKFSNIHDNEPHTD